MMLNFGSLYSKKKIARYIDLHLGQVVAIQKSNITIGQILMRSFCSQWYLLFLFFCLLSQAKHCLRITRIILQKAVAENTYN